MNNRYSKTCEGLKTRSNFVLQIGLIAIGLALAELQSSAALAIESPRGAETFDGTSSPTDAVTPPVKVILSWTFPTNLETPDLIFKVYHSTNLDLQLRQWSLLTNVPGAFRSVELLASSVEDFYVLTASNYLGESGFATR